MKYKKDLVDRLNQDPTFYLDETLSNNWKLVKNTGWEDMGDSEENLLIFEYQGEDKFYQVHIARYGTNYGDVVEMDEFSEDDVKEMTKKVIMVSRIDYEVAE